MAVSEVKKINPYTYMLLGRLQSDCEYYLNYGNRSKKCLWAGDEVEHIKKMKKMYYEIPYHQRPQWMSEAKLKYYSIKIAKKRLYEIN